MERPIRGGRAPRGVPPAGDRRRLASRDRADRSVEARSRFTVSDSEEAEASSCSAQASCRLSLALVSYKDASRDTLWFRFSVAARMASREASSSRRCWRTMASASRAWTLWTVRGESSPPEARAITPPTCWA